MEKLYNDFASVYGFIGICLYDVETGAFVKAMPEAYRENNLVEIGEILIEAYQAVGSDFGPIDDVTVREDTKLFLLQKITDNTFVYVLAEPDTNIFLLRLALNLISEDLLHHAETSLQS
ncbi:MAG: hypothetical protein R6V39_00885 [Desulfovibrionales bacterium]